jgi:light-regulated signal transduction histidine kinase (bacteriophytochrome)
MYKGELWGLIACHNYSPRFIDYKARESAKLIGQILSSALEFRQDEANKHLHDRFTANVDALSKLMLKFDSIEEALTGQYVTLLDAVNAGGAVLSYESSTMKLGKTPDDDQLQQLLAWIRANVTETFYYTNELPALYPDAAAYKSVASGIMVLTLSHDLSEYIIWFKPEHIETITWAGNPDKPAEVDISSGTLKVSPRNSFE